MSLFSNRVNNTTYCDEVIVKITHPFLIFHGKSFIVVGQYKRNETLFLECKEKLDGQIMAFPASITDFSDQDEYLSNTNIDLKLKSHFTIQGLQEAVFILDNTVKMSTK